MESVCVAVVVCVLSCCFGLAEGQSYCKERNGDLIMVARYVNVCQDDIASVGSGTYGWLVLDAAAAPHQQDIACRCYLSFVHPLQWMVVNLVIDVDGQQNASFVFYGTVYDSNYETTIAIINDGVISYRHKKQDHQPRVCMAIWKELELGNLTVRCKQPAVSTTDGTVTTTSTTDTRTTLTPTKPVQTSDSSVPETPSVQTIPEMTSTTDTTTTLTPTKPVQTSDSSVPETTSVLPIPEMTSTLSDKTEKEDSTSALTENTTPHSITLNTAAHFITTHSMQEKTTINSIPENSTAHSMPENITTHPMTEKTDTHSMAKKTDTHSVAEKPTTNSMPEKTTTYSITEKNTSHSISEKTTIFSILENTTTFSMTAKTATRSIQENNQTRSMPEATSTHTSHPEEEEPTNDITGIVAGAATGAVIILAWIVITIILVWRRKYSVRNADNPVNLHALVAGGQHAAAGDTDPQPAHATFHTETLETGSIHMYEEMELYPISPEVLPVSIDAQYVYSESYQPVACNNDDILDDYEQVSNDESNNQYLDLSSVVEDDNTACQMTRAQIHKGIAEIGIKITNNDELEVTLISREAPEATIDKPLFNVTTKSAENIELESAEGSDYEDCTIVTTQHDSIQGIDIQPTHSTTGRIDDQMTKLVRPFELSREVPEASTDTQYLYDDTGLPFGDIASALYTNDYSGNKYEQLSDERTCREHQYIDLESPEGSDYEECEIVTRQQGVTREHLLPTRWTTGISDNSIGDMAIADYINNHGNGNEQTSESDIDHQYLEIRSSTASDYADCEIINDV